MRAPLTNRIAENFNTLDWGLNYGPTPSVGALMLRDFTHWPSKKLDEFRAICDMPEVRRKPPASLYLAHASIERRNRFFGSVYGEEHIPDRQYARALRIELNRRHEALYTPEVVHMASVETVRNFIDLSEEGIRRMLRVTRRGIRMGVFSVVFSSTACRRFACLGFPR